MKAFSEGCQIAAAEGSSSLNRRLIYDVESRMSTHYKVVYLPAVIHGVPARFDTNVGGLTSVPNLAKHVTYLAENGCSYGSVGRVTRCPTTGNIILRSPDLFCFAVPSVSVQVYEKNGKNSRKRLLFFLLPLLPERR